MEKEFPERKDIRLKNYDYSLPGAYFVTICTEQRRNLFWHDEIDLKNFSWTPVGANCVRPKNLPLTDMGKVVYEELETWHKTYHAVKLYSFVVMPNHLHIMVGILADENGRTQFAPTVSRMVKQFKGAVTKRIGKSVWQKGFMEHIIRDKEDYETRARYIYENPKRWFYDELYKE